MKNFLFVLFILFNTVVHAQWTHYTVENTTKYFKGNLIKSITSDSKGNMWFGTDMGLVKFDGQNWTPYLENVSIRGVEKDALGNLWVGTFGNGVYKYDGTWTRYTKQNGLLDNKIWSLAIDSKGYKWFATELGVAIRPHGFGSNLVRLSPRLIRCGLGFHRLSSL